MRKLDSDDENALVRVWWALEKGDTGLDRAFTDREELADRTPSLIEDGWLVGDGNSIGFTPAGEEATRELVRRHRLAEVLLEQVLAVSKEQAEAAACLWEHMLGEEVSETICTFLGHPRHCPHSLPIPHGECCHTLANEVTPLVQPLTSLRVSAHARVTFISAAAHKRLDRLAALGIVPGTALVLKQRSPSYIIAAGETEIAIEESVAKDVFVRELAD
jgi:DtxR family transcriptional regulator, Mn-dependent transcriptional regulator